MAPIALRSGTSRLWLEFVALYLFAPLALWVFLPYLSLFGSIAVVTLIGVYLLVQTPGFELRELLDVGRLRETWPLIAGLSFLVAVIIIPLAYFIMEDRFLILLRERPDILILIWLLYPWFSVLGQEILYRPLFFKRYGELFPSENLAIFVNTLVFALAHAFFERWITLLLTLGGGFLFALIYARTKSFSAVFVLHWVAGGIIFTSGMGWYFYHGAIGQ